MNLMNFVKMLQGLVFSTEAGINTKFRFSQSEINEILANANKENIKYFESLANIKELSAFDVSYLMSGEKLDERKIEIIKAACKIQRQCEYR